MKYALRRQGPFHARALPFIAVVAVIMPTLSSCTRKPRTPVSAPTGQWVSLFNGKDLNDWTVKIAGEALNDNYRQTFRVEDGLLKVSYQQYEQFGNRFGSLFYNKKLSHYWIRAQYRFVGSAAAGAPGWTYKNSGIQLHGQSPESMRKEQEFPVAVEFDLVGSGYFGNRPTGDVCQNGTRVLIDHKPLEGQCSKLSDITIRDDRWTTALAEVDGGKLVRQIVDGGLVVEYSDLKLDKTNADAQRLIAGGADEALTSGYISIQSNGFPIEFRSIEILPLNPSGAPE